MVKRAVGFLFFAFLFLSACRSPQGMQRANLAYLYDPQELALHGHFQVENLSDSLSRLHYRLNSEDLLYVKAQDEEAYEARFEIAYQLIESLKTQALLDSNAFRFRDRTSAPPQKTISGYFDFRTPERKNAKGQYVLQITLRDLRRSSDFKSFVLVDKGSINAPQYFRLTDTNRRTLFQAHLPPGVPFRLKHTVLKPRFYYVSVYQRDFPLALPPYSSRTSDRFELAPDTTFRVPADSILALPHDGFFHFRLDTSQWQGFTLYSFYPSFPLVGTPSALAAPLRYLTTKEEYASLQSQMGKAMASKEWIDQFWLARAGSAERSRLLIQNFYQRVEEANRLFSSYHEGWKTDRGIVYVIYGPPNKVFRGDAGESWVYGNETSSLSYIFNFLRVDNPFSANDYELERRPQYRYGWGQAIEAWRNGHIYNSKDIRREQDAQDQLQFRNRSPYWY